MSVTYVSSAEALGVVTGRIEDVEVVLDIGPGIQPQQFVKKPYVHICVDAHRPYLERLKREVADDPKYVFINSPWEQAVAMLPDKSVDTVFALDFIEHLEKPDGLRLLREAERVARRQVLIYTPHGFFPQSYDDPEKHDRWGMDGGFWQTHRSGWELEDFGEQWEFVVCPDFILVDEHDQPMETPMGGLWAFRNLSAAGERRYHVMQDNSAWAHLKKTLERGLPPAAFNGLQSVWGTLLRATGQQPPRGGEGTGGASGSHPV